MGSRDEALSLSRVFFRLFRTFVGAEPVNCSSERKTCEGLNSSSSGVKSGDKSATYDICMVSCVKNSHNLSHNEAFHTKRQ